MPDFKKVDFNQLKEVVGRVPWEDKMKYKIAQESQKLLEGIILEQEAFQHSGSTRGMAPDQCDQTNKDASNAKGKQTGNGKMGQVTKEAYEEMASTCRDKIKQAEVKH